MDTNTILPTVLCLTLAFIFYKKFGSKKKNKLPDKDSSTKKQTEEDKQNSVEDTNEDKKEDKNVNEQQEEKEEEEEEEEETEEKKEKKKQKKRELTFKLVFDKFCDYIQKNKLVSIDAISKKLNKTKEETIQFLRELENEGKTVGFLGADGEYFYLTSKELDLLNNILLNSKNKNLSEEELEKQFEQIVKEREDSIF